WGKGAQGRTPSRGGSENFFHSTRRPCYKTPPRHSGNGLGFEGDLVAQAFQLPHQLSGAPLRLQPVEVLRTQLLVRLPLLQHLIAYYQQRVRHRNQRLLLAAPPRQPPILRRQVRLARPARGPSRLHQRTPQPAVSVHRPTTVPLTGTLVIARTQSPPRRQLPARREPAHVAADLRQHHLRGPPADPRDRRQQPQRRPQG